MAKTPVQKSTELKPTKNNQLAVLLDDLDNGLQNVTANNLLIPRIVVLQALSPQCDKTGPEYIDGAESGMICNTATGDLYGPDEFIFLPCAFKTNILEWKPKRSGLAAVHGDNFDVFKLATLDEKNNAVLPNGNTLVECAEWYGLDMNTMSKCFFSLSVTQMKSSKKLMTSIVQQKIERPDGSKFDAPLWFRSFSICPVVDRNDSGSWFVWTFKSVQTILEYSNASELVDTAKKYFKQVIADQVRGDLSSDFDDKKNNEAF